MPDVFPPAHKRVQFQGVLLQAPAGGSDQFDFGFADASSMTLEALATALAPVAENFFGGATSQASEYAVLHGVRVEQVEATGKVSNSFYVATDATPGPATGNVCTILSMAVTLETGTAGSHGRMVRGRMFPPAYPVIAGSTALLSDAQTFAQHWAGFISGCKAAGAVPAVASITGGGQIAHVTGASCGSVIDTQRRRKNHVTVQRTSVVGV